MINITDDRARRLWQQEMNRQIEVLEKPYIRSLTSILKRQFRAASKYVLQGMVRDIGFAVDQTRKENLDLLKIHYRKVFTVFGKKAYGILDSLKFISVPEMKTPMDEYWSQVNRWIEEEAALKIRNIQDTTKKMISSIIQSGMREQLSHRDIAKKIEKTSDAINPYRAKTIALTETHTGAVKAVDSAVKSTRIEMEKEWVSSKDMRTRTRDKGSPFEHFKTFPNGADRERVPMDGKFVGTGQPMTLPGVGGSAGNVVRCRCVCLYHAVSVIGQEIKPYAPEEGVLPDILRGSPVGSPDEIEKHYKDSEKIIDVDKPASELKSNIAEKLGQKLFDLKSKEMDEFFKQWLGYLEDRPMVLQDYITGTSEVIHQWALTSGDNNKRSIMMQLAAKDEFKLKGSKIWWKNEQVLTDAKDMYKIIGKPARRFLREMYNDTQEHLRKNGLKTVRVVRGFAAPLKESEIPSTIKKPLFDLKINLQPMSSFSTDFNTSMNFSNGAVSTKDEGKFLIFSEVPAERVLSTPITGFGCKREFEYVVLGSQKAGGEQVLGAGMHDVSKWLDLFTPYREGFETVDKKIYHEIFKATKI